MVADTGSSLPTDVQKSLIPAIRREDERLEKMLAEVRATAAELVAQAHKDARGEVQEARAALPDWIETEGRRRLDEVQSQAESKRNTRHVRIEGQEAMARRNMETAVARILAHVRGGPT